MKKSAFLLFLFLTAFELSAQNTVSKIFAKTFPLGTENEFIFDAFDSVQVIQTENTRLVRLMLFVDAYNTSPEMMKSLTEAGRYLIKTQATGAQLYIYLPFMKNNIIVHGSTLIEKHHFVLYAPTGLSVTHATLTAFSF